ncbi:pyruvate kinase [Sulfuriroseicoccus oceanibius]|uniref:Pyruvate kinase n=1 Tax=Sulfuriroseicoccus oceanibius TaxID=2707525 RepID=A0A6B3L4K1_9BACT|nr:pyruvate kinase [Sulfuriroseicoccus oceanibius]QQL45940.1 pyruvate kinase [Sulfuriroseicoccus oceanibius]
MTEPSTTTIIPKKTKFTVTLGPATDSEEMLGKLLDAGANVFRLNMSHGRHEWVRTVVERIRNVASKKNLHPAILMDLQGPSIRTGDLAEPIQLAVGDQIEIRTKDAAPTLEKSTTVNYDDLPKDVEAGSTIVVDNGMLLFKILSKTETNIICEVLTQGEITSRRHINLPGTVLNLPAMTDKDRDDATLAATLNLDFIAISFVRGAEHVREVRAFMAERSSSPRIVAKIEDQEAVRNINAIIEETDAVMVARGDLGIEVDYEELPIIQRSIVKKCHAAGKRVIVATHMLESMIENPSPTRAEVTDVANAVFEQADAVMLSGESSVGRYPLKCLEVLDRISRRIERSGGAGFEEFVRPTGSTKQLTCKSAVAMANDIDNSSLIVFTRRGVMAQHLSSFRPHKAPIYAFSEDDQVCRSLALSRGVKAFNIEFPSNAKDLIRHAITYLKAKGLVKAGEPLVIVSDILQEEYVTDSIRLYEA